MPAEPLTTSFRTLVTEAGGGIQCEARLALRIDPADIAPRVFSGIGFGIDSLAARLKAEGEAVERATWFAGALWNSACLEAPALVLPEEARALLPAAHRGYIDAQPCLSFPGLDDRGRRVWIPANAVFAYPVLAGNLRRFTLSTGWAFHGSGDEAVRRAYLEVVERDLLMLFWYGRLSPFLLEWDTRTVCDRLSACSMPGDPELLRVFQLEVSVPLRFSGRASFSLVLHLSGSKPFVSMGAALAEDRDTSFRRAVGEYFMLRAHQHEQVLQGVAEPEDGGYAAHVLRAALNPRARERVEQLIRHTGQSAGQGDPRLDYRHARYWTAHFDPPPVVPAGVVAKVWVDGCQPMAPREVPCGLVERWERDWAVTEEEWEGSRWHPFP